MASIMLWRYCAWASIARISFSGMPNFFDVLVTNSAIFSSGNNGGVFVATGVAGAGVTAETAEGAGVEIAGAADDATSFFFVLSAHAARRQSEAVINTLRMV